MIVKSKLVPQAFSIVDKEIQIFTGSDSDGKNHLLGVFSFSSASLQESFDFWFFAVVELDGM